MKKNKNKNEVLEEDSSYVVKKSKKVNIFAFILCVIAAFFIWVYAMNAQNNNYTKTFAIEIEVVNRDSLLQNTGLSVFGLTEQKANITIQGKKTDVQKYSEKDFRAYIDLSSIEKVGYVSMSVAVETPSSAVTVASLDTQSITVYADTLYSANVPLRAACATDNTIVLGTNVYTINVSGPRAYVEKIKTASVYIPFSDEYKPDDTVKSSDIRVFDAEKKQLSSLHMTFEPETVVVSIVKVEIKDE
ncbi:MAG: hypothetical protein E7641_05545 [Ruminococcaceae bacterium]|nr:hypothetical protein [Oscillospiraceae bacterium]